MLLLRLDWLCCSLLQSLLWQPLLLSILLMWLLLSSLTTLSLMQPHSHRTVHVVANAGNLENKNPISIKKIIFVNFFLALTWCSLLDWVVSRSSVGPIISPPGPTTTNGFPLPLGPGISNKEGTIKKALAAWEKQTKQYLPSRDINETIICPLTGSISSADDLLRSRWWSEITKFVCYWFWIVDTLHATAISAIIQLIFTSGIF